MLSDFYWEIFRLESQLRDAIYFMYFVKNMDDRDSFYRIILESTKL